MAIDILLLFLTATGMFIAFIKNGGMDSLPGQAEDSRRKAKGYNN
jgi:hypothetical protein